MPQKNYREMSFAVNGGMCIVNQEKHDGPASVTYVNDGAQVNYQIPAKDFIMLLNLYRYVKRENLRDEFINPAGDSPDNAAVAALAKLLSRDTEFMAAPAR